MTDHPTPTVVRTSLQLAPVLKQLRHAQGLSQSDLGRRLGLSQERISVIENHPEKITVDQFLTVLMALDAELCVGARQPSERSGSEDNPPW